MQRSPEKKLPMKRLSIRLLHWSVAALMAIAFGTAYAAFDFSNGGPGFLGRDTYFLLHRTCGLLTGALVAGWIVLKWRGMRQVQQPIGANAVIKTYHAAIACVALLVPLIPWTARALEGRAHEAFSLSPKFNLVSKADSSIAYLLFEWHKALVDVLAIMLAVHVAAAVLHAFIWPNGSLSSMLWRSGDIGPEHLGQSHLTKGGPDQNHEMTD